MNLVGKIFVVVIAVMSVVFMSFAVAVYATHKSYKDEVTGLNAQFKDEQARNTALKEELAKKIAELNAEKAAKKEALAKLENELVVLKEEYAMRKKNQAELEAAEDKAVGEMDKTQGNVASRYEELQKLQTDIVATQKKRDEHVSNVVKLTDQLNQLENDREQLRKRNVDLAKDAAQADKLSP